MMVWCLWRSEWKVDRLRRVEKDFMFFGLPDIYYTQVLCTKADRVCEGEAPKGRVGVVLERASLGEEKEVKTVCENCLGGSGKIVEGFY